MVLGSCCIGVCWTNPKWIQPEEGSKDKALFFLPFHCFHCTLYSENAFLASTYLQALHISGATLHKIYCQVNEIFCWDLSEDLTPSHDSAELEDMSVTRESSSQIMNCVSQPCFSWDIPFGQNNIEFCKWVKRIILQMAKKWDVVFVFCLNHFGEAKLPSEMDQWDFRRGKEFYTFSIHLSWELPDSQAYKET